MQISKIEGIGPAYARKLKSIGISTTGQLLKVAGMPAGRKRIASDIEVSEKLVLEWTNRADLMRVGGIGEEYSDLLEAAGVDTVRELARRRADSLVSAMQESNMKTKRVRRLPSEKQVSKWISQAKELPAAISY